MKPNSKVSGTLKYFMKPANKPEELMSSSFEGIANESGDANISIVAKFDDPEKYILRHHILYMSSAYIDTASVSSIDCWISKPKKSNKQEQPQSDNITDQVLKDKLRAALEYNRDLEKHPVAEGDLDIDTTMWKGKTEPVDVYSQTSEYKKYIKLFPNAKNTVTENNEQIVMHVSADKDINIDLSVKLGVHYFTDGYDTASRHAYGTALPVGTGVSVLTSVPSDADGIFDQIQKGTPIKIRYDMRADSDKYHVTYKVVDKKIVKPEDVTKTIRELKGNKLVYVSSTPYNINTHRLLTIADVEQGLDIQLPPEKSDDTENKIIQFKDENLKNALLSCMKDQNLIANEATEINEQQALKLTNSDGSSAYKRLNNKKIKDISGIKYFKNLTSLNLSRNHISDFSELKELHNLTYLDISYNNNDNVSYNSPNAPYHADHENTKRDAIPINNHIGDTLTNLPNTITNLKVANISLSDLEWLKHMTNIKELDISFNDLKSIHANDIHVRSLEKLDAAANQITDISSISDMSELKELSLKDNRVEDLSKLQNLINLQKLNLETNKISDISPLKQLKDLKELDLSDNNISDVNLILDLISNGKLNKVYASWNHIDDIQKFKKILDTHNVHIYMRDQVLVPAYNFTGHNVSLNDVVKPIDATYYDEINFTDEDLSYYRENIPESQDFSMEDFITPIGVNGNPEELDHSYNTISIKKIPHSKN